MAEICDIETGKCVSDSEWTPIPSDYKFQTGDLLEVPANIGGIIVPLIKHYGILVEIDGKQMVAHNPGRIAEIIPLENFLEGRKVERIIRTNLTAERIINKVEQCKDKGYSFFENNCEDFLSYCCECSIGYDQRGIWIIGIISIIFISILIIKGK